MSERTDLIARLRAVAAGRDPRLAECGYLATWLEDMLDEAADELERVLAEPEGGLVVDGCYVRCGRCWGRVAQISDAACEHDRVCAERSEDDCA